MGRERYRRFKERHFDAWKAQQRLAYMKLDHADQREKRRARHAKNLETGRFRCEICGSLFPSKANLDAHLATEKHRDRMNGDAPTERSAHAIRLAKLAAVARAAKKYYCGVCDYKSGTMGNLNTHCKGNPHLRAVAEYEEQNPGLKAEDLIVRPEPRGAPETAETKKIAAARKSIVEARRFSCGVCDYSAVSSVEVERHLETRKHIRAAAEYEAKNPGRKAADLIVINKVRSAPDTAQGKKAAAARKMAVDSRRFWCGVCSYSAQSPADLERHLKAKKHIRAAAEYEAKNPGRKAADLIINSKRKPSESARAKKYAANVKSGKFPCAVCNHFAQNRKDLKRHCQTQRHIRLVAAAKAAKRASQQDNAADIAMLDACSTKSGVSDSMPDACTTSGVGNTTTHYDSMLVKVIASGSTYEIARRKMLRALIEFRVRGVKTNIPFICTLLAHPAFIDGKCWTTFIDETPELFDLLGSQNRAQKLLAYLGDLAVNGSSIKGQVGEPKLKTDIILPQLLDDAGNKIDVSKPCTKGWRQIILEQGPKAFAKAVRDYKGCLIMDTTWRDAHQSLLATRVRTVDLLNIARETSHALHNLYSLECWGGATFDVAMRFLYEDPWDRLRKMRKLVPNIPFQMLLRGANGVAYSSLPDNAIYHFVDQAKKNGVDVFRVFDALNDIHQLEVGIKAVQKAGGVCEGTVCYSGDMLNPKKKYNLEYYLDLVDKLVALDIDVLGVKDMAGCLKPHAATLLIGSIRKKYPDLAIHVHTHDSAGTGVASMVACAMAGADAVDAATDSLSGMTSQPSINAIMASLEGSGKEPGLNAHHVRALDTYWSQLRLLYSPFEAHLTGPDPEVYEHEIPGGQLTNMMFQASQLGLGSQWLETKKAYEQANDLLGDIVKVTPTSKVVGDLAQFMVSNKLSPEDVKARAAELDFPGSVLEFFEGLMGQPYGGFPEPLRSNALRGRRKLDQRPGLFLEPVDFAQIRKELANKFGGPVTECDVASYIMYPKVFEDYKKFVAKYGDLSVLPTKYFLSKPEIGEEFHVELEKGKVLILKLLAIGPLSENTGQREVFYEMNGEVRQVTVDDKTAAIDNVSRAKADPTDTSQVGAPMAGVLVELRVHDGSEVKKGDPLAVLSAMKMEMVISAPHSGVVSQLAVREGDSVDGSDLICRIVKGEAK
ncbi:hypothetical protein C7999DRAFT_31377 [Corynascus novoguineensis]|uniref:Pyruvate carboxylase n=1 Tax=Corynascus novoguineensis TaxID=1126955 RepID=A0AAN7CWH2_9PEZI|nr:hypothetical protein C7999DRAFT_31377 [Corynascus novoguineensis]